MDKHQNGQNFYTHRTFSVMKYLRFGFSALLLLLTFACQAGGDGPDLYGSVSKEDVLSISTFEKNFQSYQPNQTQIDKMASLQDLDVVVMFGSWCHDSEREVPRLLKLLETSGVELASFQLIAVDRSKEDSSGIAKQLGLRYTPTFVALKNDEELARIIERPQKDIASDFYKQLTNKEN